MPLLALIHKGQIHPFFVLEWTLISHWIIFYLLIFLLSRYSILYVLNYSELEICVISVCFWFKRNASQLIFFDLIPTESSSDITVTLHVIFQNKRNYEVRMCRPRVPNSRLKTETRVSCLFLLWPNLYESFYSQCTCCTLKNKGQIVINQKLPVIHHICDIAFIEDYLPDKFLPVHNQTTISTLPLVPPGTKHCSGLLIRYSLICCYKCAVTFSLLLLFSPLSLPL